MNSKASIETRVDITIDYLTTTISFLKNDIDWNVATAKIVPEEAKSRFMARVEVLRKEIEVLEFTIKSLKGEF